MKNKTLIAAARLLSGVFRPFYMPIVGFVALFSFTHLNLLPWAYKLSVLGLVYAFTIVLPLLTIRCYRMMNGWKAYRLRERDKRVVPYLLSILSYVSCLYLMVRLHMPRYMGGIIVGALMIQITCAFINIWWKISTHSAGAGGLIGALVAFSLLFYFNPVWWLCLCFLISGLVNSSRMILRQHSLGQVIAGTAVGAICGFLGVMLP